MKKIALICVIIIVISAGFVFAQMNRGGMMTNRNMSIMSGMGMAGMMGGDIVATSDDGVVVMSFNKLYKFDRDLKLVKQVEIPFDKEYIQRMIQNIRDMGTM